VDQLFPPPAFALKSLTGFGFLGTTGTTGGIASLDSSVFDPSDTDPGTPKSYALTNWQNGASDAPTTFVTTLSQPNPSPGACCYMRYRCSAVSLASWEMRACFGVGGAAVCQPTAVVKRLCAGGPAAGWLDLYWAYTFPNPATVAGNTGFNCQVSRSKTDTIDTSALTINFDLVSMGAPPSSVPTGECWCQLSDPAQHQWLLAVPS
jgi:hypothetical protein